MPEQPLRNQVAVVAGATRGAGRGIAVCTDHTVESAVEQVFARVRASPNLYVVGSSTTHSESS